MTCSGASARLARDNDVIGPRAGQIYRVVRMRIGRIYLRRSGRPSEGSRMSQSTEQELPQARQYLPIRNEPNERGIHSQQTNNIQAGQQNAGKSILVLMHITTHYPLHVRDGKLGVGTTSMCIDVSKSRVHMQLT